MTVETIDYATGEVLPSLAECEATIERGFQAFAEVGMARQAQQGCLMKEQR